VVGSPPSHRPPPELAATANGIDDPEIGCDRDQPRTQGGQLPASGFVVLPSRIRNRCGLYPGDRVLVVASPSAEMPAVLPPRVLAAAVLAHCPELRRSES
jgi:hypothetical protein